MLTCPMKQMGQQKQSSLNRSLKGAVASNGGEAAAAASAYTLLAAAARRTRGGEPAVRLSAPGAVRHDLAGPGCKSGPLNQPI